MWTQIPTIMTAAAIAAVLAALTLAQGVAVEAIETRVFSSAAPRGTLREIAPIFERVTGHRLVIEYAFAADLKRRIEACGPFDVAILPPDIADDLARRNTPVWTTIAGHNSEMMIGPAVQHFLVRGGSKSHDAHNIVERRQRLHEQHGVALKCLPFHSSDFQPRDGVCCLHDQMHVRGKTTTSADPAQRGTYLKTAFAARVISALPLARTIDVA
jgi:hypothetical protein